MRICTDMKLKRRGDVKTRTRTTTLPLILLILAHLLIQSTLCPPTPQPPPPAPLPTKAWPIRPSEQNSSPSSWSSPSWLIRRGLEGEAPPFASAGLTSNPTSTATTALAQGAEALHIPPPPTKQDKLVLFTLLGYVPLALAPQVPMFMYINTRSYQKNMRKKTQFCLKHPEVGDCADWNRKKHNMVTPFF